MLNRDLNQNIPKGLGTTELPMSVYQRKQPIKSSDFKNIVNTIFKPKIYENGFKGKDFFFYKENPIYTQAVFFWTYKTGGAIQVDLLVKFNGNIYPNERLIKSKEIKPTNAEFQKRLSPNGEKSKENEDVWFWVLQNNVNENIKVAEDIWRVFSIRGVDWFKKFENHKKHLGQVTVKNYLEFPDFFINRFFGRDNTGILYFLFSYWLKMDDKIRAIEFAKEGFEMLKSQTDNVYYIEFKEFLENEK